MKIFVKGYARNNLGDDLFFKILFDRYKNNKFYICYNNKNKYLKKYNNVKMINTYMYIFLKRLLKIDVNYEKKIEKKSDIVVKIGGSIFMQKEDVNKMSIHEIERPFYVIGANIGPYYEEEYLQLIKDKILSKAEDVCLRDEKSYELCKELSNVRKASDIVFSLDTKRFFAREDNKKVIISVINCDNKDNIGVNDFYDQKIIELINFFNEKNYEVVLMSFCKKEKDEYAIKRIKNKLSNPKCVSEYFYRGDIDEALQVIAESDIIVGSRFHANILGLLFNKTILPIAYSDKTINMLRDMGYKGKIFDVRDKDKFIVNNLTKEDLNYKFDISKQITDSQRQFEKLDKILLN